MKKIFMFYGEECQHCQAMMPLVKQLGKKDREVKFKKLEVWHNQKNLELLRKFKEIIKISCGEDLRIPIFFHEKSGKSLCGENSYKDLKKWVDSLS